VETVLQQVAHSGRERMAQINRESRLGEIGVERPVGVERYALAERRVGRAGAGRAGERAPGESPTPAGCSGYSG
jgi:hypothetical protein